MAELWTSVAVSADKALEFVGKVAETVVETPILLMTTGFLVLGGAVGIFGRMLSKR